MLQSGAPLSNSGLEGGIELSRMNEWMFNCSFIHSDWHLITMSQWRLKAPSAKWVNQLLFDRHSMYMKINPVDLRNRYSCLTDYVCMYACMNIYICMYACMYKLYICMYVWMDVCVYVQRRSQPNQSGVVPVAVLGMSDWGSRRILGAKKEWVASAKGTKPLPIRVSEGAS